MTGIRIANAQGFWGDRPGAAARLIELEPKLDFITLDYLAEVSLSIMAIQREKEPKVGYARDFLDVVRSLIPAWKSGSMVRVVTNAGGLDPRGCAEASAAILKEAGLSRLKIGMVEGDDVFQTLKSPTKSIAVNARNLDTGEAVDTIVDRMVTASAYIGAEPIAAALAAGADVVVTGRVADPSLAVGPCLHHFGWRPDDWNRIAGATVAGHLIECGTQATGGISNDWLEIPDCVDLGFPIVEMSEDGSCVVTKPNGSGGVVTQRTVKEQLLYELGNPGDYKSPDATVSFLKLQVSDESENRIRVGGAAGSPPPGTYKVSATYRAGFSCQAMLVVFGNRAVAKARRAGHTIIERVRQAGFSLEQAQVECLGTGDAVPNVTNPQYSEEMIETVLRIAVHDKSREGPARFAKEIAPMVTGGPPGLTGYATGRPDVRSVFGYWPCLVDRTLLKTHWEIIEV